jgi:hypothetical protein
MAPRSCDQPDPAAACEPCQLSAWPDRKIITGSNRTLRTCAKYPPFWSAVWSGLDGATAGQIRVI